MTTSVIKKQQISPFLKEMEVEFVKACHSQKVSEMIEDEAVKALVQIANKAYTELGQLPAGSSRVDRNQYLLGVGKFIYCDLILYFPQVTIGEVADAVKRGIRREFGEYYGFSVVAVHMFVEKYLNSEARSEAFRHQRIFLASIDETEPDEAKKWEIFKQGLLTCYQIYKTKKLIIDCGSVNYDFLVKAGQIKLTNAQKQQIYQQAIDQVKAERVQEEMSLNSIFNFIKNPEPGADAFVVRSKQIALANYFDQELDITQKLDTFYPIYSDYFTKSAS